INSKMQNSSSSIAQEKANYCVATTPPLNRPLLPNALPVIKFPVNEINTQLPSTLRPAALLLRTCVFPKRTVLANVWLGGAPSGGKPHEPDLTPKKLKATVVLMTLISATGVVPPGGNAAFSPWAKTPPKAFEEATLSLIVPRLYCAPLYPMPVNEFS